MTISEYVCELLYRYNCVIIPELGAFLTQRIPATLADHNQLFYPPKKQISFNEQINTNDGLLANYIAKCEQTSYENANFKIKRFVQEIREELNSKGIVSFYEIGDFTLNTENKLVFSAKHTVNYLTESFGLETLTTSEITRATGIPVPAKTPVIAINNTNDSKKGSNPILKYAAVGVLLLGISGIALKSSKNNLDDYNTKQISAAESEVNNRIQSASFVLDIEESLPAILVEINTPKSEVIDASGPTYHIIAGAFRARTNATKKIKQLTRKGFEPIYIGKNSYGLHQVAYESFTNESEAINSLNKLKKTENPAAWLLTVNN